MRATDLADKLAMRAEYARTLIGRRVPRLPREASRPAVALRDLTTPDPPELPEVGQLPLSKVLHLSDFADPALQAWMRLLAPDLASSDPAFPVGREYRKHWEMAMAFRALAATGKLQGDILGIAVGNEPLSLVLTNYAKRVFATDLFASAGWEESATSAMLTDPGAGSHYVGPWRPGRLVVQHMDALDLWYEDETFDATFSSGSLEHFGDHVAVETAMREAWRVLKPGGVCTVSTEFRLGGDREGIPGVLMFSEEDLRAHVVGAAPWELVSADLTPPSAGEARATSYAKASVQVRKHERRQGLINFSEIDLGWPHVKLEHAGQLWTSCHLALRKPERAQLT